MLTLDTIKLECQIQKIFLKMISQISTYMVSMVLGIMLFFSFVVAPITFTVLDEENSRKFIRKIFPYYYTVSLLISFLVLIFFVIQKTFSLNFYLILTVAILFALSNYILMPLINKYKDETKIRNLNIHILFLL